MYHNILCNFPTEQLKGKKCDKTCEFWYTCTRKNSYDWEAYLKGIKRIKPTNNEQKQRDLMDYNKYHMSELLSDIEKVNNTIKQMPKGGYDYGKD